MREISRFCTTSGRVGDCDGEYDGAPCDGDTTQTISCNVLEEAKQLVSQQETLIAKIKECASDCTTHIDCGAEYALPDIC